MRTGRLSLNRWVDFCSTGPAQTYKLYPRKGALVPGADADIVLFDPRKSVKLSTDFLHENVDYTPYDGFELTGWPVKVFSRGELIIENGDFVGAAPRGEYIARNI